MCRCGDVGLRHLRCEQAVRQRHRGRALHCVQRREPLQGGGERGFYAATMNIRSSEARSVEIAADNVPEGYSLVLKDGETETPMNQGDIYTTDIASGENAERFKLLINKNNVSLDEIAATEKPKVSSINRNIIIEGGERVRTEVFNTLGQKVYETTKRNFTLNDLEAGAYVLRVQSTSGMQSSKIVMR